MPKFVTQKVCVCHVARALTALMAHVNTAVTNVYSNVVRTCVVKLCKCIMSNTGIYYDLSGVRVRRDSLCVSHSPWAWLRISAVNCVMEPRYDELNGIQ